MVTKFQPRTHITFHVLQFVFLRVLFYCFFRTYFIRQLSCFEKKTLAFCAILVFCVCVCFVLSHPKKREKVAKLRKNIFFVCFFCMNLQYQQNIQIFHHLCRCFCRFFSKMRNCKLRSLP